MLIAVLIAAGGRAAATDDLAVLVARAESLRSHQQFPAAIAVLQQAAALSPTNRQVALLLAETLGWDQRFHESERVYRQILELHPDWQEASIGLARTLLWQGRDAEARSRFQDLARRQPSNLDAAEGAATAAYWAGDWTRAKREFGEVLRSDPHRQSARQSLTEIAAATRAEQSVAVEATDDDQPFRSVHMEAVETFHSNPLTRWSVAAGGYAFQDRRLDRRWTDPLIRVSNRVAFPWQRLRVDSSLGVMRYGDGSTRALGGVAIRRSIGANAEIIGSLDRRELVATATAHAFHPAITSWALGWHRDSDPQRVLAAVDAGRLRYNDHNRGWFAQSFALFPIVHRNRFSVAAGGSLVARDTSESRFYVESVSSTRSADGSFAYTYMGSYTPYWTPQKMREVRAIINVSAELYQASTLALHADGGVAGDVAKAFAPAAGPGPFPAAIATYDFDRRFHPWRVSATLSARLADSMRLELGVESSATAFYRARIFRASLVRRR